jgi:DNA-binding transcriptional ArsR family regulator
MEELCDLAPLITRESDIQNASNALKALGHPLRLKILCILGRQELPVLEIVEQVGTTQSNVSQHLEVLRNKEIITSRREGSKILCKVRDEKILALIMQLRETFCSLTDEEPNSDPV